MSNINDNTILDCGHTPSKHESFTTGYGTNKEGKKHCYECCAKFDKEEMVKTGKAILYLIMKDGENRITNWPGTLVFKVSYISTGRHNMAGKRYDAWFTGPDGKSWHGVQYGDNTQVIHCRRIKG